jgi:hypothetical protein
VTGCCKNCQPKTEAHKRRIRETLRARAARVRLALDVLDRLEREGVVSIEAMRS